ncbi:hypothetical protein JXR93_13325 [bacterium]|nr:hypothetical protein [bacterium]
MEKGLNLYIKISTILLFIASMVVLYAVKVIEDLHIWYRLLNVEGIIIGAFVVSLIQLISLIKKKKLYSETLLILGIALLTLFLINKNLILSEPTKVDIKYIFLKFSILGAIFYSLPLYLNNNKKLDILYKLLGGFSKIFILSYIFTTKFKISIFGFIITFIFLLFMFFLVFGKDKK